MWYVFFFSLFPQASRIKPQHTAIQIRTHIQTHTICEAGYSHGKKWKSKSDSSTCCAHCVLQRRSDDAARPHVCDSVCACALVLYDRDLRAPRRCANMLGRLSPLWREQTARAAAVSPVRLRMATDNDHCRNWPDGTTHRADAPPIIARSTLARNSIDRRWVVESRTLTTTECIRYRWTELAICNSMCAIITICLILCTSMSAVYVVLSVAKSGNIGPHGLFAVRKSDMCFMLCMDFIHNYVMQWLD